MGFSSCLMWYIFFYVFILMVSYFMICFNLLFLCFLLYLERFLFFYTSLCIFFHHSVLVNITLFISAYPFPLKKVTTLLISLLVLNDILLSLSFWNVWNTFFYIATLFPSAFKLQNPIIFTLKCHIIFLPSFSVSFWLM